MWKTKFGYAFKPQKFHFSCVPCSLQMILTNMGLYEKNDDIENLWNELQLEHEGRSLNDNPAPNIQEISNNLANTDFKDAPVNVIGPGQPITDKNVAEQIAAKIRVALDDGRGLVIGVAHAHVVQQSDNGYVFVSPSPSEDTEDIYFATALTVSILDDGQENPTYIIKIKGENSQYFEVNGDYFIIV